MYEYISLSMYIYIYIYRYVGVFLPWVDYIFLTNKNISYLTMLQFLRKLRTLLITIFCDTSWTNLKRFRAILMTDFVIPHDPLKIIYRKGF